MKCLKCDGTLKPVVLDGVEVDQCDKCSGIWFDLGELDEVLSKDDISTLKNKIDNNQGHDEIEAFCPRCNTPAKMVRVAHLVDGSLHIDTCMICYGNWLDGGELERLKKLEGSLIDKLKSFLT